MQVGWESSYKCAMTLFEDFQALVVANEKVNELPTSRRAILYNAIFMIAGRFL
jgi:hypothetical protein